MYAITRFFCPILWWIRFLENLDIAFGLGISLSDVGLACAINTTTELEI